MAFKKKMNTMHIEYYSGSPFLGLGFLGVGGMVQVSPKGAASGNAWLELPLLTL